MFRDGILDADDEVALIYERDTYRNLSSRSSTFAPRSTWRPLPMSSTNQEKEDLLLRMKSLYFPDRSHHALHAMSPRLRDYFQASLPPISSTTTLSKCCVQSAPESPVRSNLYRSPDGLHTASFCAHSRLAEASLPRILIRDSDVSEEKHGMLSPCLPIRRQVRKRNRPSCFCTIPRLIQRPSPVPFVDFVVKNGSNSRFALSGEMPTPVSEMKTLTPAGRPRQPGVSVSRTLIRPPSGIAWIALLTRFMNTCFNSDGKPCTVPWLE